MAVNPVSLAETLRPWHGAGLVCLLRDPLWEEQPGITQENTCLADSSISPEPEQQTHPLASASLQAPHASRAAIADEHPEQSSESTQARVAASSQAGEMTAPPPASHSPASPQHEAPARQAMAAKPELRRPQNGTVPGSRPQTRRESAPDMPEEWQRILDRTQAAPLLWTYAELGGDLSKQEKDEDSQMRSRTLRSIIGKLNLPKGSSCFWPITLTSDWAETLRQGQAVQDTVFFHSGLERISPKGIVLFGQHSNALSGLNLGLRLPFTQQIVQRKLVVLLPSFADLQGNEAAMAKATAYLRSAFSNFPALFIR